MSANAKKAFAAVALCALLVYAARGPAYASYIAATNWLVEVARGNVGGTAVMAGYGEVSISGALNNQDLWGGYAASAVQPEPVPAGYQLWVESDDAADTSAGTGARTVTVVYIDTAGASQTVTATLAGTTPVNTLVTDCQFVNEFYVATVGTGLVATGNVDCTQGSGGAVVSRILASGNWALSSMRMVPTGKTLYMTGWHASANSSANNECTLRLRASSYEGTLQAGVYLFKSTVKTAREPIYIALDPPVLIPAGATVKISCWTAGATDDAAGWRGVLIDG